MRRLSALVLVVGLVLLAVPAAGQGPVQHPHALVLGVELDEFDTPVGYHKCVDLAAGNRLPNNAHHEHLHVGTAGEMLFSKAGHAVVPLAPLTPWSNCEELIAFFFGE